MNEDDQLLRQLGELAREEPGSGPAGFDERWERLAAGTLSAEEESELRRLAETSDEARAAYEAFRPLGGDFQAGVVRAIREQAARPARERGNVLPFRRVARRVMSWATAAAAAVVAFVIVTRPPALPGYEAEVSGGSRTMRSEAAAVELAAGDRCQVRVQPLTAVRRAEALSAEAYLQRGAELRRLEVESEVDPRGSARLVGELPADLAPGEWTLWAVVGRSSRLPDPERLRSLTSGSRDSPVRQRHWVAVPKTLRIRPPAS